MATDAVVIYNLALDAVGARITISSPVDDSREAEVCNLWFPNIRDLVLSAAPWPEATKMERLALLATQDNDSWLSGEPRPDLLNSYATPADMLQPQYLSDYSKFTLQSYGAERKAIMTGATSPILIYTFRQTMVSMWSQGLQMAIMYGLAASICTTLTGKTSRTKTLVQQANDIILSAREAAANTSDERLDSIPDWIAARGYVGSIDQSRYFYPLGSLLISNVS